MRPRDIRKRTNRARVITTSKINCPQATAMPGSLAYARTFVAFLPTNGRKSATPYVLKEKLATATRRAGLCILMLATSATVKDVTALLDCISP